MRHAFRALLLFTALSITAAPALASVPKVIFADEFGFAT